MHRALVISSGTIAAVIALLIAFWHANRTIPTHYWSTIVGMEMMDDELLVPLQSSKLIGLKSISLEHPLVTRLELSTPVGLLKGILVAVYKNDPHLNWRRAHLLHQGPTETKSLSLAFPLLACSLSQPGDVDAEETLLMLKPNVANNSTVITMVKSIIQEHNLKIISTKLSQFTKEEAIKFYSEHEKRSFFDELIEYVTSGPCLGFIISGKDAIRIVRDFQGPVDPIIARIDAPNSLRALYGIDKTMNSFHASDSLMAAAREISFLCGW